MGKYLKVFASLWALGLLPLHQASAVPVPPTIRAEGPDYCSGTRGPLTEDISLDPTRILVVYRGKLIDLYDAINTEQPQYLMTTYVTEERNLGRGETGVTAFGMDFTRNTMVTFKGVMERAEDGTPNGMDGVLFTDTVLPLCKGKGTGGASVPAPEIALTTVWK